MRTSVPQMITELELDLTQHPATDHAHLVQNIKLGEKHPLFLDFVFLGGSV